MIFSGQRNSNGSVGAETLEPLSMTPFSQAVASATAKPVVLVGKSIPQPVKSSTATASSLVEKWQTSQPAIKAASRPAGSWW